MRMYSCSKRMMTSCVLLFLLSLVQMSLGANSRLSDEEYELMPPTVSLEPFEKCLRYPGGWYCTAFVTFVADEFSPLLQQMKIYSAHSSSHYNHTQALLGTCLTSQKCKTFHDNSTMDLRHDLEACLNHSIWEKYSLKVKVEENISCHEFNEKRLNVGVMDIAVASVLVALVICNAAGSLFDIYSKKLHDGLVVQFLLCFSISRNWKSLTAPPEDRDPHQKRLRGIYGIRAISMTLVIFAHSMLSFVVLSENPKFLEDQYEIFPIHILLSGSFIMQTFLFLSAFLLVYTHLLKAEQNKITWKMVPKGILKRWFRLTPPYAIVLAVTATWMKYLSTGPIWEKMVVLEAEDCRRYWWKHLLYINNYDDSSQCMVQAWYLAADFQLHCLGLITFVICQGPTIRKVLLTILFLIGLITPALHTYYQDLDAVLLISPSSAFKFFLNNSTFNKVYKRGHTNIASYVIGLGFGYLVYSLHKNNFDVTKYKKWRPLYWFLFPLSLSITMACKVFYEDGPRVSIYYRALVSAFSKPLFGLLMGLIIVGMILKVENVYRRILEWDGWLCPGRVSYSAYLLHVAFIRSTSGASDHTIQSSYLRIIEITLSMIVVTYIAAYLFCLTVEMPIGQVMNACLQPRPTVVKTAVNPEKTVKKVTKL